MIRYVFICLVSVFIACSSRPVPGEIIVPEKMQFIIPDMILVDEYINQYLMSDTSIDLRKRRSLLYGQVFTLHNTNRKEFYSSYKYYQQHPDLHKVLFDSVYQVLNRKKDEKPKDLKIKDPKI
jgi:hypothetical protein